MYLFFVPINVKNSKKRKSEYRKDLKFFTQNDISTISFSKWKGRLNDTFQFQIENAFDTSNINKSNQMHEKSSIDYPGKEDSMTLLFLTQNNSYNTLCTKMTDRFKQLFDKGS